MKGDNVLKKLFFFPYGIMLKDIGFIYALKYPA